MSAGPTEHQYAGRPTPGGSGVADRPRLARAQAVADRVGARARALTDRAVVATELVRLRILPRSWITSSTTVPEDTTTDATFLRRPALLGFLGLLMISVGASLPSSPFKLEMPGAWFFGMPRTTGANGVGLLFGLVAVYGGLVLFMRVWYRLAKVLAQRPGVPIKYLVVVLAIWIVPMLIVPPLFSRDVYSYAAQGEMVSRHINPYVYGPFTLGGSPYVPPVDPLWLNTPAPYGPLFLIVDGLLASLSLHNMLATVVLLRIFAVVGVLLIAWAVPKLARLHGRDPGAVFGLAVLNPLVLFALVASAHNDAIMVGLLLCGLVLAKQGRPVLGVVLVALAAAIKVPAELAVIYIGWDWLGPGLSLRQRVRPVVTALLISAAVMVAFTIVSGLGFGWIGNLETPGTVRSWLAPATGIGMVLSGMAHLVHIPISQSAVLSVTRVTGLLGAAVASVYLLLHRDRIGSLKAMGLSFLLFVALGPVVQPWYLSWGVIVLALVATGRLRSLIVAICVLSPFIGLPGGRTLLDQLIHSNPLSVAAALLVLAVVLVVPLGRWTQAWRSAPPDQAGALPGGGVAVGRLTRS